MLKNALLQKAHAEVDGKVTERGPYDKIVKAGLKVIYDQTVFKRLSQGLRESKNPVQDIARGIVGILAMLSKRSKGTMPPTAMVHAGATLLIDALDFAEQAGLVKVDNDTVAEAFNVYMESVLPTVGLTTQRMQQVLKGVEETVRNPERMAAYQASLKGGKK